MQLIRKSHISFRVQISCDVLKENQREQRNNGGNTWELQDIRILIHLNTVVPFTKDTAPQYDKKCVKFTQGLDFS